MVYSTKYGVEKAREALARRSRRAASLFGRRALRMVTAMGGSFAGLGATASFYTAGALGMAGGVAFSVYSNQKEYQHSVEQLTELYSKEISSLYGIGKESVAIDHLKTLAEENPTLKEELTNLGRQRNAGIARYAALAVIGFTAGSLVFTVGAASAALAGLAGFTIAMTASTFLNPVSKQLFGVDPATTVDRIKAMEWQRSIGRSVSKAQVLDIFVAAKPELAAQIKTEHGTSDIMEIPAGARQSLVLKMEQQFKLSDVTDAINRQELNPRELTFRAYGQSSGAYADPSYRQEVGVRVQKAKQRGHEKFVNFKENAGQNIDRARSNAQKIARRYRKQEQIEAAPISDNGPATSPAVIAEPTVQKWQDLVEDRRGDSLTVNFGRQS